MCSCSTNGRGSLLTEAEAEKAAEEEEAGTDMVANAEVAEAEVRGMNHWPLH